MTYTATISSKGQITIPIEARRKLKLGKTIHLDIRGNELVIKAEPTIEEIRAILNAPSKPSKLSEREQVLSDIFTKKYLSKNDH